MRRKHIVYKYIDLDDHIIKYVGITSRKLKYRVKEHEINEEWVKSSKKGWHIDYFYVNTKSDSEAWESHLITLYKTDKWYNSAKSTWGLIDNFKGKEEEIKWLMYSDGEDLLDIDFSGYQVFPSNDLDGLITDQELCFEYDLSNVILRKLVLRKVIQPIGITDNNNLVFFEPDKKKIEKYFNEL